MAGMNHSACPANGLYVLPMFFSLFLKLIFSDPTSTLVISESTRLIFKFSGLVGVYARASLSVHSFCDRSRGVSMTTNFVAKFAKVANPALTRHTGVPKWIGGLQFRFKDMKWQ